MKCQYSVAPTEDLRRLCIRKDWFTCGTCEQYMKMFDLNKEQRPIEEVALAIWLCCKDVSREEITKELCGRIEACLAAGQELHGRGEEGRIAVIKET